MKKLAFLALCLFGIFSLPARAAVVVYHDGEAHPFDAADTIIFADALTVADPQVTYGFILGVEDHSFIRVSAPADIRLGVTINTRPDFKGQTIYGPESSVVWPGESADLILWGDWMGIGWGEVWWLSIGIFDDESLANLVNNHGGSLPLGSYMGGTSPVPVPSAMPLLGTGLMALGFCLRKRQKAY